MFEDTSEVLFDQFTDAPGGPDDIGMVIAALLSEESRDRADLRHPALDRAGLQAGQGRAGLGRLLGPLRCRHPPPPGPRQLRVQLLLGRPVPQPPGTAPACRAAARTQPQREGAARRRLPASAVVAAGAAR